MYSADDMQIVPCSPLINASLQQPASGLVIKASQQQTYISWHKDTTVKYNYSTSLLLACQHAVLLWERSPYCCAVWLSLGDVSGYGGVFAEKKQENER